MEEYTLYLDESEIPIKDDSGKILNTIFAIGGVILKNEYHNNEFTERINEIKHKIWNDEKYKNSCESFILHEMEVTNAHNKHFAKLKCSYNREFAKYSKYNLLYREISSLIDDSKDLTVICAFINVNELYKIYNPKVLNDRLSILMQIIIENYYHFLVSNDAIGKICYEYIDEGQNKIVNERYQNIKRTGTMFYPAKKINKKILDLYFEKKSNNIAGLQLADFVPNTLGRFKCDKDNNSNKNFNSIYSKLYDGCVNMSEKFGLKEIP